MDNSKSNLTEAERSDCKARIEEWMKKGEELQVAVIGYPRFVQNEQTGNFEIEVVTNAIDIKYAPKPSPYNGEAKK